MSPGTKQLYKVESFESKSLEEVTAVANTRINDWANWKKEIKIDVNKETGFYYFVLMIYKD